MPLLACSSFSSACFSFNDSSSASLADLSEVLQRSAFPLRFCVVVSHQSGSDVDMWRCELMFSDAGVSTQLHRSKHYTELSWRCSSQLCNVILFEHVQRSRVQTEPFCDSHKERELQRTFREPSKSLCSFCCWRTCVQQQQPELLQGSVEMRWTFLWGIKQWWLSSSSERMFGLLGGQNQAFGLTEPITDMMLSVNQPRTLVRNWPVISKTNPSGKM